MAEPLAADVGVFHRRNASRWLRDPYAWPRTSVGTALSIAVAWRVAVAAAGIVAHYTMPRGMFSNFSLFHDRGWSVNFFSLLVDTGVRGDANYYADIALHGYYFDPHHMSFINFYPLFPILIKLLSLILGNVYVAGTVISTTCIFAAVVALVKLLEERGLGTRATLSVAALLSFPWSMFFATMYTESLFLFLVVSTFLFCERRRWLLAAVCAFLLMLSRPTGIEVLPSLLIFALQTRGRSWQSWLPPGASVLALATFGFYQYLAFGTPIASVRAQGVGPGARSLSRGVRDMLLQGSPSRPTWVLATMLGLALLLLLAVPSVLRLLGPAYAVFAFLAVAFPAASGLIPLDRYVVVDFPAFVALAYSRRRWLLISYFVLTIWLLFFFAAAFEAGWALF